MKQLLCTVAGSCQWLHTTMSTTAAALLLCLSSPGRLYGKLHLTSRRCKLPVHTGFYSSMREQSAIILLLVDI